MNFNYNLNYTNLNDLKTNIFLLAKNNSAMLQATTNKSNRFHLLLKYSDGLSAINFKIASAVKIAIKNLIRKKLDS